MQRKTLNARRTIIGLFSEKLSFRESRWPFLIIISALLIYGYSLTNGYIWDDDEYVHQNPSVSSWTGLKDLWISPKTIQYYPLTFSSFWLEHKLYGFVPWGSHTVNLLLHIFNALLLWGLLRQIAPRFAGITAFLFTIHPIQVETVAWITERKNLLCFFFYLLAFRAFLRFEATGRKKDYGFLFFYYLCALFSKTIAVSFATVPLLYAWWKKGAFSKRAFLASLPLFLVGGIFAFITITFESTYAGANNILTLTLSERTIFVGKIFFFYLKQILFPWKFMFFYPLWDIHKAGPGDWLFPAATLGLFLIFFLKQAAWGRGMFTLLCLYAITLFPALGFFDLYPMQFSYVADHFSYVSVPAILLLFCGALSFLFSKIRRLGPGAWEPSPVFKKGLFFAISSFLAASSFLLTLNYKNEFTLWTGLIRENPRCASALNNLAVLLPNAEQSIFLFQKAIAADPSFSLAYENLGNLYKKNGFPEEAVKMYQRASVGASPSDQAFYYHQIAKIYQDERKAAEAISFLEKTIALSKTAGYERQKQAFLKRGIIDRGHDALPYYDLGSAYLLEKKPEKAAEAFRTACQLAPQSAKNFNGLGAAFMTSHDIQSALEAFEKAAALDPTNERIKMNLQMARALLKTLQEKKG